MSDNNNDSGRGPGAETDSDATTIQQASPSSDYKVRGKKQATDGTGVLGWNTATSGASHGLEGVTDSTVSGAAGVRGVATTTSGKPYGVLGFVDTPGAQGVVGAASDGVPLLGFGGTPTGVWGYTDKSSADPNVDSGYGVYGQAGATSGEAYGVFGTTSSPADTAYGVYSDGDSRTVGDHEVTGHVSRTANATVFLSSNQEIPGTDSPTRIAFDTTNDSHRADTAGDDFGAFDTTNHKYVVPVAGDYRVDVTTFWSEDLPAGTGRTLRVMYANGTEAAWSRETPPSGGSSSCTDHGSTVLMNLSPGDDIRILVSQDSGSPLHLVSGRNATHVSISHVG